MGGRLYPIHYYSPPHSIFKPSYGPAVECHPNLLTFFSRSYFFTLIIISAALILTWKFLSLMMIKVVFVASIRKPCHSKVVLARVSNLRGNNKQTGIRGHSRVSIQGVKSLWGDRVFFPQIGHQRHWQVANKPLFLRHLSVSLVPNLGKMTQSPRSDLTPWILTLR